MNQSEQDKRTWLLCWVALVGALAVRFSVLDFESGDYRMYLSAWYDHFLEKGRWVGLAQLDEKFASYPPLYMTALSLLTWLPIPKLYAIKVLSIAFDFIGAYWLYQILRVSGRPVRFSASAALICLYLPTTIMNSAVWGQCDMMYTSFFLLSLYGILSRRSALAMIAFGFAVSLKPQAIFWIPLLGGLILAGHIRWSHLLWPVAVYVGVGIPQMLAGRPWHHVLLHWLRVENIPGITLGAPNVYQWVFASSQASVFWNAGIVLAMISATLLAIYLATARQTEWSLEAFIPFAYLSVAVLPFFLPGMHERYFFAADIISLIYAAVVSNGWKVALLTQIGSASSYIPYLFEKDPIPGWCRAAFIAAAIGIVLKNLAGSKVSKEVIPVEA